MRFHVLREKESIFFGVVALLGSGSILLLHSLGASQATTTSIPVLLMLVYAGIEYFIGESPGDELGDRLYYLGFLLTLTSVGYSLWKFEHSRGDVEAVLGNFGIALATTITGLVLRVVLNQINEDPVELERRARGELRDAARDLRIELISSVEDIGTFRRSVLLSLNDGLEAILERFSASLEKSTNSVAETANQAIAAIGNAAQESSSKIDAALLKLPERAAEVDSVVRRLTGSINECSRRIENIHIDPNVVSEKLAPLADAVSQYNDSVTELVAAQRESTRKLRKSFDSLSDGATKAAGATVGVKDGFAQLLATSGELAVMLTTFSDAMKRTSDGLLDSLAKSSKSLQEIEKTAEANFVLAKENREALEIELQNSRNAFGQMHNALAESAQLIVEKLGNGTN